MTEEDETAALKDKPMFQLRRKGRFPQLRHFFVNVSQFLKQKEQFVTGSSKHEVSKL